MTDRVLTVSVYVRNRANGLTSEVASFPAYLASDASTRRIGDKLEVAKLNACDWATDAYFSDHWLKALLIYDGRAVTTTDDSKDVFIIVQSR